MPTIIFHKNGQVFTGEVQNRANLVVRAGIKRFPYPHLSYGCGMGKCAKCASKVLSGGENLPPANWKEKKLLGDRLGEGYRLMCQLWITDNIELSQDDPAVADDPASGKLATTAEPSEGTVERRPAEAVDDRADKSCT